MPKEHMPINDQLLMAHLEEQGRRDLAAGAEGDFLEEEEGNFPRWESLKPKLERLARLAAQSEEAA